MQDEVPGGGDGDEQQTMRVYLRARPFSKEELSDHEDQVQHSIRCHPVHLDLVAKIMMTERLRPEMKLKCYSAASLFISLR